MITHVWENRHSAASLIILELSKCAIVKKSRAKQFTSPSALSILLTMESLSFHPPLKPFPWGSQPCLCLPSVETSLLCPATESWHRHKNVSWGCACSDEICTLQCVLLHSCICPAKSGGDEQLPKYSVLQRQKVHLGSCIPGNTVKNREVRKACSESDYNTKSNSLINGVFCQMLFHLPSELSALMTTSTS